MALGPALVTAKATRARAEALADTVLQSYAQLLFSRSRAVGALLLAATAVAPRMLVAGLLSVLLSAGTARALRLSPEAIRAGAFGYNALLTGLGIAAVAPATPMSLGLGVVAVIATVLLTAAMKSALGSVFGLPVLSLPFIAVYYLVLGAAPLAEVPLRPLEVDPWASLAVPAWLASYVRGLGSVLFLPRLDAGLLVLLALATSSRISLVLSLLAVGVVAGFTGQLFALHDPSLVMSLGLNGMLVAVALGGVWFVPSVWSYALAALGVLMCGALSLGVASRFGSAGLPQLILPFNATVMLVLYAMRQRISDGRPTAVDAIPGTPEENVARFRAREERFGAVHGLRFGAPFRGRWTCSQTVAGGVTHEGLWRDALDFEVRDAEGNACRDGGSQLTDYYCYRLPVVAPLGGVVARVVEGVADNQVGEVNLEDNWGNAVVIYHAPGVYSCLAHLAPGSIAVYEGQPVRAGEVLGLCGNSGRSATPHLHLQLQASAQLGAPTLELALHDVVLDATDAPSELFAATVPATGASVRSLAPDADRAKLLAFEYGRVLRATITDRGSTRTEELLVDLDPTGRHLLRSTTRRATLHFEPTPTAFTVLQVEGDEGSVLHLINLALSRVPFDTDDALTWSDRVPLRLLLPSVLRPVFDALSPFGLPASVPMRYSARRRGRAMLIEGTSSKVMSDGRPWVSTSASLAPGVGLFRLEARVGSRELRAELDPAPRSTPASFKVPALATSGGSLHVQS